MMARLATEDDRERWDDFVMSVSGGSFLQSWFWGQLQKEQNNSFWRIIFEKDGEVQAVTMLIKKTLPFGGCWLYVPRGPIFSKTGEVSGIGKMWQDEILNLAKKEKAVFVRCDPVWEDEGKKSWFEEKGWCKAGREIQPRHTLVLGLEKSEEELMAEMHTKTRYNVRLAERKGVRVRFSTEDKDIELFLELSREVTKRSSFGYHPDNYYKTMLKVLKENNMIEVAVAEHEGVALAANVLIMFGGAATYVHGASSEKKRNVMAPQLLMWESIKRVKLKGAKRFDFYGVAPPESDKEHDWSGITRLKLGFGGKRESYIGAYDYVLRSGMYRVLNMVRRMRGLVK